MLSKDFVVFFFSLVILETKHRINVFFNLPKKKKHKGKDIQKEQTFPNRLKEDSERHSLWAKHRLRWKQRNRLSPFKGPNSIGWTN